MQQPAPVPRNNFNNPGNRVRPIAAQGRVNHISANTVPEGQDVVLGTFLVNSVPASVLFDSGASHSFINEKFVETYDIPKDPMRNLLLVNIPGGKARASHKCPRVKVQIKGVDFRANLIILKSSGIDVILGMD